mmetsp:Transcript_34164/g.65271  ORF Transcript_34164/g.65271 Transcript_34164/m.65271 type:complete len:233 (+) Transcript_34164:413-1111(+)
MPIVLMQDMVIDMILVLEFTMNTPNVFTFWGVSSGVHRPLLKCVVEKLRGLVVLREGAVSWPPASKFPVHKHVVHALIDSVLLAVHPRSQLPGHDVKVLRHGRGRPDGVPGAGDGLRAQRRPHRVAVARCDPFGVDRTLLNGHALVLLKHMHPLEVVLHDFERVRLEDDVPNVAGLDLFVVLADVLHEQVVQIVSVTGGMVPIPRGRQLASMEDKEVHVREFRHVIRNSVHV